MTSITEKKGSGYRVKGTEEKENPPQSPFYKGGSKENEFMKCFIIIGMPAAGKDIARQAARAKGYPYFATGDIVRAQAARRQVSPDAESMAKLSTELRGSDGLGVTRLALVWFMVLAPICAAVVGSFNRKVYAREDLVHLGLPVLGVLPAFPGDRVGSLALRMRRKRV